MRQQVMETIKREYCQRNFGSTMITISKAGQICITDGGCTNWGIIYNFQIEAFKNGVINPCTGFHVQVIGMDSEIYNRKHANYIYNKIKKGFFDHLIEK